MVKNLLPRTGDLRDPGLIPGWGRSPEEGNGNPLQYSCLENSMDRGSWRATVHGGSQSRLDSVTEHTHTPANSGGLAHPLPAWALTSPARDGQGLVSTTDDSATVQGLSACQTPQNSSVLACMPAFLLNTPPTSERIPRHTS